MRQIRYIVAMSLDGYIAGPNGEADWIEIDPDVDFGALWAQFDTGVMGRRTYEAAKKRLGESAFSGLNTIVFSKTLRQQDHKDVTVVSELRAEWVQQLRADAGKDIWLFGGGELFRTFLQTGNVDTIEVSVIPVLLGNGVPLLPSSYSPSKLSLLNHKIFRSGRVSLVYQVGR